MRDEFKDNRFLDEMIEDAQAYIASQEEEYHGYRGSVAHLKDGRSGKILDGKGLKLYLQDIDGGVFVQVSMLPRDIAKSEIGFGVCPVESSLHTTCDS